MADFALVAPPGSYLFSLGACLDGFALVRGQVERMFAPPVRFSMESRLRVLTIDGKDAHLADGRRFPADGMADGPEAFDLVHLAAFRIFEVAAFKSQLAVSGPLLAWLREQARNGCLVSASGSGILLLAAAGLLDGMAVPMPRTLLPVSRQIFPRLHIEERSPVVERDNVLLGNGLAAEAELIARLVERVVSPELGRWLSSVMGLERVADDHLARDPLVADAQLWLEQHFAEDFRIGALAAHLSTTHQTLIRRFTREVGMGPRNYVRHLRVLAAQRMLRRTRRSVEQIAQLVGYRDARSFRDVFREHSGMSATAYRTARTSPG